MHFKKHSIRYVAFRIDFCDCLASLASK